MKRQYLVHNMHDQRRAILDFFIHENGISADMTSCGDVLN